MNFSSFSANFQFRAEVKKVTSRAELKILQLELWLEPARLGLITNISPRRESDVKAIQPVPGNNTLAANLMARAWNSSSELQTATTIGAARTVAR